MNVQRGTNILNFKMPNVISTTTICICINAMKINSIFYLDQYMFVGKFFRGSKLARIMSSGYSSC